MQDVQKVLPDFILLGETFWILFVFERFRLALTLEYRMGLENKCCGVYL